MPLLRLLWYCDALDWQHLPVAGGVYDQHPDFLEGMLMLKELRGKYEEQKRREEEAKRDREMASAKGKKGRRR